MPLAPCRMLRGSWRITTPQTDEVQHRLGVVIEMNDWTEDDLMMMLTDKGVVLFRIPSAMGDLTYEFRGSGGGLAAITMLGGCPL